MFVVPIGPSDGLSHNDGYWFVCNVHVFTVVASTSQASLVRLSPYKFDIWSTLPCGVISSTISSPANFPWTVSLPLTFGGETAPSNASESLPVCGMYVLTTWMRREFRLV